MKSSRREEREMMMGKLWERVKRESRAKEDSERERERGRECGGKENKKDERGGGGGGGE